MPDIGHALVYAALQDTLCPPAPSPHLWGQEAGDRRAVCLHFTALASRGAQAELWGKPPCALPDGCAVRARFGAKSAGFVLKVVWHIASMYRVHSPHVVPVMSSVPVEPVCAFTQSFLNYEKSTALMVFRAHKF